MPLKDKTAYNTYMKEYMLQRYRKRQQEAIKILGGQCVKCDSTTKLEIDHVRPQDKQINLAKRLHTISHKKFLEELTICQLLCKQCHHDKTMQEFELTGHSQGSKNANAKLTEAQIIEIRNLYQRNKRGYGCQSIAKQYGVSKSVIYRIISNKGWTHVDQ